MPLEFVLLADREEAIPQVAQWYFEEWGDLPAIESIEHAREQLKEYLNRDSVPFILLAVQDDEVIGAVQLKFYEMADAFPDKEYWLGGVYVTPALRGCGYGSSLIEQLVKMAPEYGVRTLHLQTEALDGGLYARLGWKPYALAKNRGIDVLVMERHLAGEDSLLD